MTILILNWRDIKHPLSGGAEISLFEHAKYWQNNGAYIIWFASSFTNGAPEEIIDGIRVIRRGSHFTVHIYAYLYYVRFLKNKIDIILDNFHFIPFFTPLYIKNKKILVFINEPAREAWFKNINIFIAILGYILEPLFFLPYRNIQFLTGSTSIAKELSVYGINSKWIKIVPHGTRVNFPIKGQRSKTPLILYLGQLSPDKGIEDAIKMFAIIKKKYPSIVFMVAGKFINQDYEKRIFHLTQSLKLTKKEIIFLGFISEKEKYRLLQEAWILIHPSIREGWGLTVIEAACYGTPTVGYRVVGLSDSIQHMSTGILTDRNTPEELAKSTLRLLYEKKLYDTLSRQARIYAKEFSWEKSGKLSFDIIKKAYEGKTAT